MQTGSDISPGCGLASGRLGDAEWDIIRMDKKDNEITQGSLDDDMVRAIGPILFIFTRISPPERGSSAFSLVLPSPYFPVFPTDYLHNPVNTIVAVTICHTLLFCRQRGLFRKNTKEKKEK